MTRDPMVVHPEDDAEPLLTRFDEQDFNAFPVIDPEGNLLGVVTKLSLLRLFRRGGAAATSAPAGPSTLRVRDVMGTRNVSVEPTDNPRRGRAADDPIPCPERAGRRAIREPAAARRDGEPR